jgi:hypothetical protein
MIYQCSKCPESLDDESAFVAHWNAIHGVLGICDVDGHGLDRDMVLSMIHEGRESVNYDLSASLLSDCPACYSAIQAALEAEAVSA